MRDSDITMWTVSRIFNPIYTVIKPDKTKKLANLIHRFTDDWIDMVVVEATLLVNIIDVKSKLLPNGGNQMFAEDHELPLYIRAERGHFSV